MEKEGPTDVLAFPMDELRPGLVNEDPEEGVLGDLVLCPGVAEAQGVAAGHGKTAELELLTVHGILHLLGYDHALPEEHKVMFGAPGRAAPGLADLARLDHRRRRLDHRRRNEARAAMTSGDAWLLVGAAALVGLAGLFSAADAALALFSRARAEELAAEGRAGSRRLLEILDDRPRYLNTALFLRLLCEIFAIVLVTLHFHDAFDGARWPAVLTTVAVMLVVSFVVIGVSPRTVGRQKDEAIALVVALPLAFITRILGPLPRLLILVGNAITPGKGFREGPFNSETELRELVDLAEATAVIESGERKMIHSVFELGDTIAREVMVPRTDIVFIERKKNLRQAMSLFLKSGYSRVPVIGDNLDEIVGFAYLKDIARRDFEAPDMETVQRVEEMMRPAHYVPDSKPVDELLSEMQADAASTSPSSSTSTAAPPAW